MDVTETAAMRSRSDATSTPRPRGSTTMARGQGTHRRQNDVIHALGGHHDPRKERPFCVWSLVTPRKRSKIAVMPWAFFQRLGLEEILLHTNSGLMTRALQIHRAHSVIPQLKVRENESSE